jgi:hypothetical protein
MADNLAEMPDLYKSTLSLDYEAIAEYEPPTPLEAPKEPSPSNR